MDISRGAKRVRRGVPDAELCGIAQMLGAEFCGVWTTETRQILAQLQTQAHALFSEELEAHNSREQFLEMKDRVTRQASLYRAIYADTLALIRAKEGADLNKLHRILAEIGEPALQMRQLTGELCSLLTDAFIVKSRFYDPFMEQIARRVDVTFEPAPIKGIWRCMQKMATSTSGGHNHNNDASGLVDIVRGALCSAQLFKLVLALEALRDSDHIQVTRIKNRFKDPNENGWADVLVNFYFVDDDHSRHICEVQLVHSKMMLVRKPMGAHESYAKFRRDTEIMEQLYQLDPAFYVCLSIREGCTVQESGRLLHLQNRGITGTIPTCLRFLTTLQLLDLSGNQLTGPIPKALSALTQLHTLNLVHNRLSGEVPREVVELPRLTRFMFTGNTSLIVSDEGDGGGVLERRFSISVQTHTLSVLYATTGGNEWRNHTRWMIDYWSPLLWFGVRTDLDTGNVQELRLNNNNLRGHIPESIKLLRYVRVIQLSNNQLSGSIPESIADLTALAHLDLSHNQLTGFVPARLSALRLVVILEHNPCLHISA